MIIGVPKEIRDKEKRIALTPEGAKQLVSVGHKVLVERGGGVGQSKSRTSMVPVRPACPGSPLED